MPKTGITLLFNNEVSHTPGFNKAENSLIFKRGQSTR